MRIIILASSALMLAACNPSNGRDAEGVRDPEIATANRIEPDDIVTFPKGPVVCRTERALRAAFIDTLAGNEPELGTRFEGDAQCITLDPASRYKVVGTDQLGHEMPEAVILRVVEDKAAAGGQEMFVLVLDRSFVRVEARPDR
ncbi:hypothetical protein [Brevundimonas sp.]|uniref:hypothetical protein n=1 Tax=Brevundimonas sp. TaxID=1871086 RepID=UPI002D5B2A1F|nr:hypothetical protein [Brevundimonas sp.]HYC98731.1 hypothetical protein [Brevundimonas sp.]